MEVIVMESKAYRALIEKIEAIERYIGIGQPAKAEAPEIWLDNATVCAYMKISKRTLQRYRSNGLIAYSLVGHKTYYAMSELVRLLKEKRIFRGEGSIGEIASKGLMTLPKE